MSLDIRNYAGRSITVHPYRELPMEESHPVPVPVLIDSIGSVDTMVASRFEDHQNGILVPSEAFYQHPSAYSSRTRDQQEKAYEETLSPLMGSREDENAIVDRRKQFDNLRRSGALINFSPTRRALGGVGTGLNTALLTKETLLTNFAMAHEVRKRNAGTIVKKWGEQGQTYIENTARSSNTHALTYFDALSSADGMPCTTPGLLKDSGITAASIELELARIAEVRFGVPED